jgi:hypothetical protein
MDEVLKIALVPVAAPPDTQPEPIPPAEGLVQDGMTH